MLLQCDRRTNFTFKIIGTTVLQLKVHGKEQNGKYGSVPQMSKDIRNTWESFKNAVFDFIRSGA